MLRGLDRCWGSYREMCGESTESSPWGIMLKMEKITNKIAESRSVTVYFMLVFVVTLKAMARVRSVSADEQTTYFWMREASIG